MKKLIYLLTVLLVFALGQSLYGAGKKTDNAKNIILILADDMGYHLSAVGTPGIKTAALDGLAKKGVLFSNAFSTVDHYATLLDLLHIPFPRDLVTDGVSFVPALKGKKYERQPMYSTFCHNVVATGNRANISMGEGQWKLYKFYFDGDNQAHRYELYNLNNDIDETHNLADKMPDRVKRMAGMLDAHAEEAKILLPCKNENYAGNVADAWHGSADTKITVSDKVLHISSSGSNPFIETDYTPNFANTNVRFVFEMKSNSGGMGEVSWKGGNNKDCVPENMVSVEIIHDGEWHDYSVQLPLKEVLKAIRLKPATAAGDMQVRNIRLETSDCYYMRDWPLY